MLGRRGEQQKPVGELGGPVVFGGSNSLWIALAVLAALAVPATLWIAGISLSDGDSSAATTTLLIGVGIAVLFALGALFAWRERREVLLGNDGITIRSGNGRIRAQIPWAELIDVEERRIPSQPLQSALLLHRDDGSALLIDPQQVRDTTILVREIRNHPSYGGSRTTGRGRRSNG